MGRGVRPSPSRGSTVNATSMGFVARFGSFGMDRCVSRFNGRLFLPSFFPSIWFDLIWFDSIRFDLIFQNWNWWRHSLDAVKDHRTGKSFRERCILCFRLGFFFFFFFFFCFSKKFLEMISNSEKIKVWEFKSPPRKSVGARIPDFTEVLRGYFFLLRNL